MSKSALYKQFKTDKTLEKEGVSIPYGETEDGKEMSFRVARMGASNKKYQKAVENATKPHRNQIRLGTLSNKVAEKINLTIFVTTILLGWENVESEDGELLEFNKENAIQLMKDLPELYADLQEQASNTSLFRDEELEGDSKN